MGIDLGEVLATQACGELSYEIDNQIVKLLADNATDSYVAAGKDMRWNKRVPLGVSKRDHYAGFAEIIGNGSVHIYEQTQKYSANYMVVSPRALPVLALVEGFKPAAAAKINGPYFAGTLLGIKVYVSPIMQATTNAAGGVEIPFFMGFNGGDMITSAAVYAPYMAIVPTQLLGYADGAMSQGFSTLYDLKLLNKRLLVKGLIVDENATGTVTYNADAYNN